MQHSVSRLLLTLMFAFALGQTAYAACGCSGHRQCSCGGQTQCGYDNEDDCGCAGSEAGTWEYVVRRHHHHSCFHCEEPPRLPIAEGVPTIRTSLPMGINPNVRVTLTPQAESAAPPTNKQGAAPPIPPPDLDCTATRQELQKLQQRIQELQSRLQQLRAQP